jgi:general secretion pathway protein D
MKKILMLTVLVLAYSAITHAEAEQKVAFTFKDADLSVVIAEIGRITGKNFIVDPQVRGKISILPQGPLTVDEAYKAFNIALMINGDSIVDLGDFVAIQQAQTVQRSQVPVYEKLPPGLPAQMMTYIRKFKYASARNIYNSLGPILQSRLGEMRYYEDTNEMITTDYAPNLYRIAKLFDQFDTPESAKNAAKNVTKNPKKQPTGKPLSGFIDN